MVLRFLVGLLGSVVIMVVLGMVLVVENDLCVLEIMEQGGCLFCDLNFVEFWVILFMEGNFEWVKLCEVDLKEVNFLNFNFWWVDLCWMEVEWVNFVGSDFIGVLM